MADPSDEEDSPSRDLDATKRSDDDFYHAPKIALENVYVIFGP